MSRREGYVIDVPYPLHFHKEMQPVWMSYIATSLACSAPDITQPYRYCELGCGAGINLLVAAASNPLGEFVGVDFNSGHIALARQAAQRVGLTNLQFIEASFGDFAAGEQQPFDFIACHGTWSWLPPQAQASILKALYRFLKPGGLFYLHYMCHPGATRLTAIQKVLHEVSLATPGDSANAVRQGVELLRCLADNGAGAFEDNPGLKDELAALEKAHETYLAHDFLTDYWRPQHCADVHRVVAQAELTYIGSADCFENMDSLAIPGNIQPILNGLPSTALRETVKDLARNQHQRLDMFQRQPNPMTAEQHLLELDRVCFTALDSMPVPGGLSFATPIGIVPGPQPIFEPLLRQLLAGPKAFSALRCLPEFCHEPGVLLQALQMLMWAGYAHPMRAEKTAAQAAGRLDAWLAAKAIALSLVPECGTAAMHDVSGTPLIAGPTQR